MTEKGFEFKLCSNGYNYLYKNNELYITEKGDYVLLEQKGDVVELLNELAEENEEFKIHEEFKNKAYSDLLDKFTQLKKKYQKSKKENKRLKKELDSFNPVVFNDMVKGTVILYNKGDDVDEYE